MYAVLKTGGKQFKVAPGETIKVEKLEVEAGKTLDLNEVLLVENNGEIQVGKPFLKNAKVQTEVVSQEKGKKITILFYRRRKQSNRRKMGHRQNYTLLKIKSITDGNGKTVSA